MDNYPPCLIECTGDLFVDLGISSWAPVAFFLGSIRRIYKMNGFKATTVLEVLVRVILSRFFTFSQCPQRAASISGVLPSLVWKSVFAPRSSRSSTTAGYLSQAAKYCASSPGLGPVRYIAGQRDCFSLLLIYNTAIIYNTALRLPYLLLSGEGSVIIYTLRLGL